MRERGLKSCTVLERSQGSSRSREGAWIEMAKFMPRHSKIYCRSREGAWIEITGDFALSILLPGRSREGAWIEMP